MTGNNWDVCADGLPHPRKWVYDNAEAIANTAWGKEIDRWISELPNELVLHEVEENVTGGVVCTRRYSSLPEPSLPTPSAPVEDDSNTLAETWRLREEQRHSPVRPSVKKASWKSPNRLRSLTISGESRFLGDGSSRIPAAP
jgi:hypothetical protein